jgi:hypothetical protein
MTSKIAAALGKADVIAEALDVCREGNCDEAPQDLDDQINHYINKHQYHLLHVGQETTYGEEGTPWQSTVAVLGRE